MHFHVVTFASVIVLLIVQAIVFMIYVWPRIREFRHASGASSLPKAAGVTAWAAGRVVGLKHSILAFVTTLAVAMPDLLSQLRVVDWTGTTLAQYAPMIGLACVTGLMIFNAMGVQRALHTEPPVSITPPAAP